MSDNGETSPPSEQIPRVENAQDLIDIRLVDLRTLYDEFAVETDLTEGQIEWGWTMVRAAFGAGYDDRRRGLEIPRYEGDLPGLEMRGLNERFKEALHLREQSLDGSGVNLTQ